MLLQRYGFSDQHASIISGCNFVFGCAASLTLTVSIFYSSGVVQWTFLGLFCCFLCADFGYPFILSLNCSQSHNIKKTKRNHPNHHLIQCSSSALLAGWESFHSFHPLLHPHTLPLVMSRVWSFISDLLIRSFSFSSVLKKPILKTRLWRSGNNI